MRKILVVAFLFMFAGASAAFAEKIAIFDLQVVADKSVAMKEAFEAMEKAIAPERDRLDTERAAIEAGVASLTDPKTTQKQRDAFLARQGKYANDVATLLAQVKDAEMQVRVEMDNLILKSAAQFATREGFDLVLDTTSILFQADSVKTTNVTEPMLKEVDKLWMEAKKAAAN